MHAPNCPDHGRLVFDLALGRLDDEGAVEAEAVTEACSVCRGWWRSQLGGPTADLVDDAVKAAFDGLELPVRRRNRGWMAAAAALVMALGAATLWLARNPAPSAPETPPPAERTAAIQSLDFEPVVPVQEPSSDPAERVAKVTAPEPRFVPATAPDRATPDEVVIAEVAQVELPGAADAPPLFTGGFESGDLAGWVPST